MATSKTTLKKVQARRKALAKRHPRWSNSTLLKEAWKPFKGKVAKKSAPKKHPAKKTTRKHSSKAARPVRRHHSTSVGRKPALLGSMGSVMDTARQRRTFLYEQLGKRMADQYRATTKLEKRRIAKKIAETKSELRKIDRILKSKK